jgi:acyl-CoA synthetase (AMP-forming)/AMP-acid ligase II
MAGERALLLYPPGLEYIAGFFGCLYAGTIAVPAYPPNPARLERTLPRLQAMVANAGATVVLTNQLIQSLAGAAFEQAPDLGALRWIATNTNNHGAEQGWQEPDLNEDSLAFLQYTSGSTGTPKGVMLSHANLLHNLSTIRHAFEMTFEDVVVIWLPPYHDMGLIGGIMEPLYVGCQCILISPAMFLQRPLRWLQAISRYSATVSGGPNFAYDLCARRITPEQRATLDLSRWRLAFSGAEPIRQQTLDDFTATFEPSGFRREAFYPCYGLAEASLLVTGGPPDAAPWSLSLQAAALENHRIVMADPADPGARTLVGSGQIPAGQQVAIVDPETMLRSQPDCVGEIWLSSSSIAQGYWARPEETTQTFQASIADTGEGPFMRTGDLGFVRDNELFVAGRLKDLIIVDGRNHYPQDIEATVAASHPAVRSGCIAAFSVEVNGIERLVIVTEVERGFMVAQRKRGEANGGERDPSAERQAMVNAIRRAVSEQHELGVYAVVLLKTGYIPKTSSGKIQRHACRAKFLEGTLDVLED